METETKETIPLWLAVAITVVVSLPFGLYLDTYNLPLWVAFIVWAEYFALGAKPEALRVILPSYALAAVLTGIAMVAVAVLAPSLPKNGALVLCLFIGVGAMVYIMRYSKTLQAGSLPYVNGISMLLGVYFTGAYRRRRSPATQSVATGGRPLDHPGRRARRGARLVQRDD
jgi:hypothetical protein